MPEIWLEDDRGWKRLREWRKGVFKVKEEKVLLMAAESKQVEEIFRVLINVIQDCTVKPQDFDATKLTTFDLEYVFLALRSLSVGETAPIRMRCKDPECDGETEINVNLQDIKINAKEDVTDTAEIQLTDKIKIEITYPRVDHLSSHPEMLNEDTSPALMTYDLIKSCILKVFADDQVFIFSEAAREEQDAFVDEMTPEHTAKIKEFFDKMPQITIETRFNCEKCGQENDLLLRGLQDFFSLGSLTRA